MNTLATTLNYDDVKPTTIGVTSPDTQTGNLYDGSASFALTASAEPFTYNESESPIKNAVPIKENKVQRKEKVIRRLRGFVQSFSENDAIVVFIQKNEKNTVVPEQYSYAFPKHILAKNRITAVNQPFEMDQIEVEENEYFYTIQKYRPIAEANSVEFEPIEFNQEYKDKLNQMLTFKD